MINHFKKSLLINLRRTNIFVAFYQDTIDRYKKTKTKNFYNFIKQFMGKVLILILLFQVHIQSLNG
jgi:hypothetical protein